MKLVALLVALVLVSATPMCATAESTDGAPPTAVRSVNLAMGQPAADNTPVRRAALVQPAVMDFDGDGKTDYVVARTTGNNITWYLQRSALGFAGVPWGSAGDKCVPADYDGDHKWDIAVWRPGAQSVFYILQSLTNTLLSVPFGITGDDPLISQDFDGDGKADPAVVRSNGAALTWYILRSSLGFTAINFGLSANDATTRGDFDGDGKADVAVYRTGAGSPTNTYFVLRSSNGQVQAQNWGEWTADYLMPADFDGDGKTDYAVFRFNGAVLGAWYWLDSATGTFHQLNFGAPGDVPAPGDYDGDGKSDQAVWRTGAPGTFYVNRSLLGFTAVPFGTMGDRVVGFDLQAR
ncbi:MAG: VCBS repeat-containing protein [Pyrinomonadaceae bacterium]